VGEEEPLALLAGRVLLVFALDIDDAVIGVVTAEFGFAIFPGDVDPRVGALLGNIFGAGFADDFPHFCHFHSPFYDLIGNRARCSGRLKINLLCTIFVL